MLKNTVYENRNGIRDQILKINNLKKLNNKAFTLVNPHSIL